MKRISITFAATGIAALALATPSYAFHCYNASKPINEKSSHGTYDVTTDTFTATNPGLKKQIEKDPEALPHGGFVTVVAGDEVLAEVYSHKKGEIPNGEKGTPDHGVNYLPE